MGEMRGQNEKDIYRFGTSLGSTAGQMVQKVLE